MNRGVDYDWTGTRDLPERHITCGFCGRDITTKEGYTGWFFYMGDRPRADIYICHVCGSPNFFSHQGIQYPIYKKDIINFSDAIQSISPKFVNIYTQASIAEQEGLSEIIGPGYGKAIEFLIKDYVIGLNPDLKEDVEKEFLGNVIKTRIENPKIEEAASRASWLRNDETHYVRKWTDKDITDLKRLIDLVVNWIEFENTHNYFLEAMPSPAPKEE